LGSNDAIDLAIILEMPEVSLSYYTPPYVAHYWPDPADHAGHLAGPVAKRIRAVQTNGSFGIKRPYIEQLPALEIIAVVGAGFEGVDLAAARERGIVVTYGIGANSPWVAEQAWALMLAAVRRVPQCDRGVREGQWSELRQILPAVTGRKLGIFGLGHVGKEVARRGRAFDMEVGYCNRSPRTDVDYRYFERLADLAAWCDVLVVTAPGGPATRHAVDAEVLTALGPEGYVVNVARGTIVDSAALVAALREGRIAGAGLDVIEGEPAVPPDIAADDRIVLSPHIGGFALGAVHAMMRGVRANLDAHFAGKPVPTPVPH
jgi:lactate dehydrogenase-like 2-hydroxyacid dehydrogenase